MPGRAAVRIELTGAERAELEARARRRKSLRADALRAEIVLLAASGMTNLGIAKRLGITRVTVTTWRNRFAAKRLGGLLDEPAATHWSTRSMARASGLSVSTVHRIWRAFSLQPLAERILNAEMDQHLAAERTEAETAGPRNHRNGHSRKTVLTGTGALELQVPRDRQASEPLRVRRRRFGLSQAARGMSLTWS
jgi:transcriptional regulator with XRE-family HTH domain